MPEVITLPKEEWERLQERVRKLALEKSYLQLINDLMSSLSEVPGLEHTIDAVVRLILEKIGGVNVALFCLAGNEILYADAFGTKKILQAVDDPMVKSVLETGQPVETTRDFRDAKMTTSEFTKASSWALPLQVGGKPVGVLKMDGMLIAPDELRTRFQPFFNYAALVLKNDIENYEQLTEANEELTRTNAKLAEEIMQRQSAESSLRITQFAVDHASECLFWISPDARFANVNNSTCRRLGYSREELLGMTVFDVDPAFPREAWDSHWREIRERKSFTIETKHKTKTGEVFPVEVTLNYVEYEGAEYNFAFARDVSERKKSEEALRRANEELEQRVAERTTELQQANEQLKLELAERARIENALKLTQFAMDSAADVVFWIKRNGSFFYANKAATGLLGYTASEFLKMKASDVNPDHRDAAWQQHWADLKEQRVLRFESELVRKDGRSIPVEVTANYVEFETQAYNCAFVRDITERRQAEDARRESEQKYHDIFDNVLDGLYLLEVTGDGRFRTLEINSALERSTGIPRSQVIGRTQEETVPEEVARIVNAKYRRCVEAGRPIEEESALELPAGRRYYYSTLIPLRDDNGRVNRIIGISRDITDRKQADEELRRLNSELEQRVKERTAELESKNAELERMNRLFVGRELRMRELKERIAKLEGKTGGGDAGMKRE